MGAMLSQWTLGPIGLGVVVLAAIFVMVEKSKERKRSEKGVKQEKKKEAEQTHAPESLSNPMPSLEEQRGAITELPTIANQPTVTSAVPHFDIFWGIIGGCLLLSILVVVYFIFRETPEADGPQAEAEAELNGPAQQGVQAGNRRIELPCPAPEPDAVISVREFVFQNFGTALSELQLPITFYEPLTYLQRISEELEYSYLLDECSMIENAFDRMVRIAAFIVSGYTHSFTRANHRPFLPVLGETYELNRQEDGWNFLSEEVNDDPHISAWHCTSDNFLFFGDVEIATSLSGFNLIVEPKGSFNIKLIKWNEKYSWNKITTSIRESFSNNPWVEHHGKVHILNHELEIGCELTFTHYSHWKSKVKYGVSGIVHDKDGTPKRFLDGKWNESISVGKTPSFKTSLWKKRELPPNSLMYYGFTEFAMQLNELNQDQLEHCAATDSRFRPDQRLLENGQLHEAESEFRRIEEIQKEKKEDRENTGIIYAPKWFSKVESQGRISYTCNNRYWIIRDSSGFTEEFSLPHLW